MTELYDDIFARWVRAFNEINWLSRYKERVENTKYAPTSRYSLEDYDHAHLPAHRPLSDEKPPDGSDHYSYGMDAQGRPVHVAHHHTWNKVYWEGFYSYSDDRVEYIEFELGADVPTRIEILQLNEGRKVSYQQFSLNGAGNRLAGESNRDIIEKVRNSDFLVICNVKRYIYEKDRIIGADCLAVSPGIGRFLFRQTYLYDGEGRLDEIKNIYENGNQQVEYARVPLEINVADLSDRLSREMADSIVETLLKNNIEQPLATLELSYRSVTNYMPSLVPKSLAEWDDIIAAWGAEADFELLFIPSYETLLSMDAGGLEHPLQQMVQIMEQKDDYSLGMKMLRKAAYLLTRGKLNGKIAVSDHFVAYAIEWECEGHEFEEILRDCGLSEEVVTDWKIKGWI